MTAPARGLVVDLTGAQSLDYPERGVARYVQELAAALLDIPGLVRGLLLNPARPLPGGLHPALLGSPLLRWNTATELRRIERGGPVAYLMPSPLELGPPVATVLPPHVLERPGIPVLAVLYDLVPLLMPDRHLESPEIAARYRLRLEVYRSAAAVLALSGSARDDAVRLLGVDGGRIAVVGAGASAVFRPAAPDEDRRAAAAAVLPVLDREFVLYVAGTQERKNVERLIEAWGMLPAALRARHRLVVVCRLDDAGAERRWRAAMRAAGLSGADDVVLAGQVDDAALACLLRAARLQVFPSLYEGFGLPVAEAAACGCPVITSSTGATPEVLAHPPGTFDPRDARAIAALTERALTDAGFEAELRAVAARRAALWTWPAVAGRVVRALSALEPPGPAGEAPWRLALVGRLPPSPSPAATANARLVDALSQSCHVEVFTPTGAERGASGSVPRLPIDALVRRGLAHTYDVVVHCLAGHPDDLPVLRAAREVPGVLWLHAIDLSALHVAEATAGGGPSALAGALRRAYRDRAPQPLLERLDAAGDGALPDADGAARGWAAPDAGGEALAAAFRRYGILLTAELVSGARAVLVPSASAARRLAADRGPRAPERRLTVVDRADPEEAARALLEFLAAGDAPAGTAGDTPAGTAELQPV